VLVSTDDPAIGAAARHAGAEIVERPAELADDDAPSESAVLHALDWIAECGETEPDIVVLVQCTSPFIEPGDIDGTVAPVATGQADCALTVADSHGFLWRRGAHGAAAVNHDSAKRPRRQDRDPEYLETGAVYAMDTQGFRAARHRFFGRIALHQVPRERSIEIDEPEDLALADALAARASELRSRALPPRIDAIIFDFDGVLTDNRVVTLQDGTEAVISDRSDGLGIERLRCAGARMLVLSKERNAVVAARCAKLGLECIQGVDEKAAALHGWLAEHGILAAHTVFVGNDVNDLECLELVGCGVVVGDAHPDTLAQADIVLSRPGGRGAVRELADLVLHGQGVGPT
jgi:N-acylneuraminate cytidylyltransferase